MTIDKTSYKRLTCIAEIFDIDDEELLHFNRKIIKKPTKTLF